MAATTTLLGLVTPTQGTLSGTWGDTVNYGISDYLDIAIAGTLSFAGDGAITLANTTGSSAGNSIGATTAQYMVIRVTGTQTITKIITGPSYSKLYMVDHAGATSAVTFKAAGQTGVSVAVGEKCFVYYNGTDYVKVASSVADGVTSVAMTVPSVLSISGSPITSSGTLTLTYSGTALPVANGGTGLTAGTSGGVLAYTATGTLASSVALTANALVLGAGAGATPTPMASLGTTTTVLHGNASGAPTFGAVSLTADVTGILPTANGGTNLSSFTSGGVVYASSSSVLATGSALTFDGSTRFLMNGVRLDIDGGTSADQLRLGTDPNYYKIGRNSGSGPLEFYGTQSGVVSYVFGGVNGEQMRLTSTGLGIGTSSPAVKLDVNGNATVRNTLNFNQSSTTYAVMFANAGIAGIETYQGVPLAFATGSGGTATEKMRLDSAGNLGLGVTPVSQNGKVFHIDGGAGAADIRLTNNATGSAVNNGGLLTLSGSDIYLWNLENNILSFGTNNTERARITAGGYFKASETGSYIGSTGTYHELVNDSQTSPAAFIKNSNASFSSTVLAVTSGNTTTNNTFYFLDCNNGTPATKLRIADSGNVTNANNSYGAISDIKLKENIVDATPKLEKLNQVRVVNYNFIGDQQKQLGVVAQELEQVFPSMIDESQDKDAEGNDLGTTTKAVKYSVFVPMLIKAIQEQQAIIESLKARLDAANL